MKCPICQKQVKLGDPCMPFCSERCKTIDLGNWASEKYVIPASADPSEHQDDPSFQDDRALDGNRGEA